MENCIFEENQMYENIYPQFIISIDLFHFTGVMQYLNLKQIESEVSNQNFSQAINLSNSFTAYNLPEENYQYFYKIYSTYYSGFPLPFADYTKLVEIAEQCPLDGGKAVFEARALRNHIDRWNYDYIDLCEENEEKRSLFANETGLFTLYPNPSNGLFNINNSKDKNGVLIIYDLSGNEVYSFMILEKSSTQIELDISNGMYLYKMYYSDNTSYSGKLSIIK